MISFSSTATGSRTVEESTCPPDFRNGKVVHFIGQLDRGGAEKQLFELATALRKRGWNQTIVSFWPGGMWSKAFKQEGFALVELPPDFLKLRRLLMLLRLLSREHPCIVHSWSSHTNVYAWLCMLFLRESWIASVRENPLADVYSGKPLRRIKYAGIYPYASCVVTNSHCAMEALQQSGVHMKSPLVVPNIVHARGRAVPGIDVQCPVIVAAGWLKPLKAYDVLIEALALVQKSGRLFRLLLAGEGPERHRLEKLAVEHSLTRSIDFLGSIEDVQSLMTRAHICVHPSLSEGLSNTILEAMGEGLPVIASPVGGNLEIISQGVNGIFCPPNDPVALSSAIIELIDNREERMRLGEAGLAFIRENMGSERIVNKVHLLYARLLNHTENMTPEEDREETVDYPSGGIASR